MAIPHELRVTTRSGSVRVEAEDRSDIVIDSGRAKLHNEGPVASVDARSDSVNVRCPTGCDVVVGTLSGSVKVGVAPGLRPNTRLKSLSGKPRVSVETGNDCVIAVSTLSGQIELTEA